MQFSRIATFFAFFMGLSFFVLGNPVVTAEKRDSQAITSATTVVNNLKTQSDAIVAKIKTADKTNAALSPLINELISAVSSAQSSVSAMQVRSTDFEKRQLGEAIAVTVAGIVESVAGVLTGLDFALLGLGGLISSLDFALFRLISGLDIVVVGLGGLLGGLLAGVGGLLGSIGFGLTLGLLGL